MTIEKKAWTTPQLMVLETVETQVGTTPGGPEGVIIGPFTYSS